jgi:hypothetical protein
MKFPPGTSSELCAARRRRSTRRSGLVDLNDDEVDGRRLLAHEGHVALVLLPPLVRPVTTLGTLPLLRPQNRSLHARRAKTMFTNKPAVSTVPCQFILASSRHS